MKKKCEHLEVDGWHVPTQEAREVVRSAGQEPYGWRDQVRAEMSDEVAKWMWPGLCVLLVVGVVIRDWLLITGASVALLFFLYQAINVVRALRAGEVVTGNCNKIIRSESEGEGATYSAQVRLGKRKQDVTVTCQRCVEAVQSGMTIEVMVVMDPGNAVNNWLVGYRLQ